MSKKTPGVYLSDSCCCKGQQGNIPCPVYGYSQYPLVFGTVPGYPSRDYFTPFGSEQPQHSCIFIIYINIAVSAESAHFSPVK